MERDPTFDRLRLLIGTTAVQLLHHTTVILFGVGGVGSWCAEALIRSGIGRLTIVDPDPINRTNLNRQLQATASTVGKVKVQELLLRLMEINPHADIIALRETYAPGDAGRFQLSMYDYVIDAIDSLTAKVDLIASAVEAGAKVYTALGAACKIDPTKIRVGPLMESYGCRLGKMVRKRLRRRQFSGNPLCVYSEESAARCENSPCADGSACCDTCNTAGGGEEGEGTSDTDPRSHGKRVNGSAVHVTATFGFFLAGLVVQDVVRKERSNLNEK